MRVNTKSVKISELKGHVVRVDAHNGKTAVFLGNHQLGLIQRMRVEWTSHAAIPSVHLRFALKPYGSKATTWPVTKKVLHLGPETAKAKGFLATITKVSFYRGGNQ